MKHTKEPWKWGQRDIEHESYIFSDKGILIAVCYSHEAISIDEMYKNNERITACVNACAGITTEALQAGVIRRLIGRNRIEKDEHGDEFMNKNPEFMGVEIWEEES